MIRPLLPADVAAAREVQWAAMSDLDVRLGEPVPELTPERQARGFARIAHLQSTDPDKAFVAELDGRVVGCALALEREGMWFLSLLMVDPAHQGKGVGRALLDATLATATDRSWILATSDPAALRRYRRAGFELHPTFTAKGAPVVGEARGVRTGTPADADLVDAVAREARGAALGPDIAYYAGRDVPFLVVDDARGRGFSYLAPGGIAGLAATSEDAARRLLAASIAASPEGAEVDWLGVEQQWAIDVCLDARLALRPGATICLRGQPPMPLCIPSGALG